MLTVLAQEYSQVQIWSLLDVSGYNMSYLQKLAKMNEEEREEVWKGRYCEKHKFHIQMFQPIF